MSGFADLSPLVQALIATLGTWGLTAVGATLVLFTRKVSRPFLDASLGFAAGVMIAASFWSLLAPSIDHAVAQGYGDAKWIPPLVGFLLGAACLRGVDLVLPHMHPDLKTVEGLKTPWQRSTLLVLAITIHNIPEGLAAEPPGRPGGVSAAQARGHEPGQGALVWAAVGRRGARRRPGRRLAGALDVRDPALCPGLRGRRHDLTGGVIVGFAVMMTLDVALG
jgi:zinc transporter ZupT